MKLIYKIAVPVLLLLVAGFVYFKSDSKDIGRHTQYALGRVPIEDAAKMAGGIFIGKVVNIEPAYLAAVDSAPDEDLPSEPLQEATIEVERWILNAKDFPDRFNIAWFGGEVKVGNLTYSSEELVNLKQGERILMFIGETTLLSNYKKIIPFGYWQGIYRFRGNELVAQDPEGIITRKTTMDEVLSLVRKRVGTAALEKSPVLGETPTGSSERTPTVVPSQ